MKRHNLVGERRKSDSSDQSDFVEIDFLIDLVKALLIDIANELDLNVNRDIEVINMRVRHEGVPFFTKTLPAYGKTVLSGLRSGVLILPPDFPFKRAKRGGAHPAFLQGILGLVFDENGYEKLDAPAYAVKFLEQVCFIFYKYELPTSMQKEAEAFKGLIELESSYKSNVAQVEKKIVAGNNRISRIAATACNLLGLVFETYDHNDVVPKHGPGAVLDAGTQPHEKYKQLIDRPFPQMLEARFAQAEWTKASPAVGGTSIVPYNRDFATLQSQMIDKPMEPFVQASRVIAVPKDSRGPRVISAEHTVDMYFQQGIWNTMKGILQVDPLTRGHVNFTDQTINGKLALEGSLSQNWATLDLKEASDRLSYYLVRALMPERLFVDLDCTRATQSYVMWENNFRTIELNKFAPMGSAVCFPVESVIFWALCVATIHDERFPLSDYKDSSSKVYVYGDDIIVPTQYARLIADTLEEFGLKVNTLKSYYQGYYRESCGVDAFKGENVTPLKAKTRLPQNEGDVSGIIAWTEYSNALYERGYWQASDVAKRYLEQLLRHRIPVLPREAGCLRLISFCGERDPSLPWEPAGHVGRKNGKILMRGNGWMLTQSKINFGAGERLKVKMPKTKTYTPSWKEFSDDDAYLRWFLDNGSRPPLKWDDYIFGESSGSSRTFSLRNQTTWRIGYYYFT